VLPDLVELEPAFIQHLDVLGDCDLAEVNRSFGDRVCLMGNYNPVVLSRGSLRDARREAQRCLDGAMEGGGYVMTTSDEVPADARPENMLAVVRHVARHGRYQ
jgi:uroporphyrinogen decarboxylase